MKKAVSVILVFALAVTAIAQFGSIAGIVVDSETGEPLAGVNIKVIDKPLGAATNLDGAYLIERLAPGTYSLAVRMLGYSQYQVIEIEVKDDEVTKLNISLAPEAIRGDEVIVTASRVNTSTAGLLSNQKRAQAVSSGISSEQISKAPDASASDALKRITGLTVADNKFVVVRGLSERYSQAQLNNASIPSPEPDKRVVPFDIFPSDILDNAVVRKAFVPNLPADFAGGCIQLTTKEFPQEFDGKFSVSLGGNENSVFQDFQTYSGGAIDFLGFDDGTRGLPEIIAQTPTNKRIHEGGMFGGGYTAEEIEEFGESFANIWSPYNITAPVNQSYSLSMGNQVPLFGNPLGFIASFTYKNSFSTRDEERYYYIMGAQGLEARHNYDEFRTSTNEIVWGGILNGSYRITPQDKVSLKFTLTHNNDDEVRVYGIYPNRDHNLDEICTRLRWVQRSLYSADLSGEHITPIKDMEIDWRLNYSIAKRHEPDTREILYEAYPGSGNYRLADESNSGSRFFSDLTDNNVEATLDFEIPFRPWNYLPSKIQFGTAFNYKDRQIESRRFRFKPADFNDVDITQDPEDIFTPENIARDRFFLDEDTRPTDNYEAGQILLAGFAMADLLISKEFRAVVGARVEYSDQEVRTFDLFNPQAPDVVGEIQEVDIAPAFALTYKLTEDINIRLSGSQTLSRPSFRELSSLEFTDIGGHAVVGNPELERALIKNADMGWEWYPNLGENFGVSLLYKHFTNPIEQTLINATELTSSWQNAKSAYAMGVELEARKNLGFISGYLLPLTVAGNLTLIESHVELQETGMETNKNRPLQGQSPYVANMMISYENIESGTDASLSWNVFGERISEVGIAGTPDIYEEPVNRLDMVIAQRLTSTIKIKLSCKNLLDPEIQFTQGDKIQRSYKSGRSYSLGASYEF